MKLKNLVIIASVFAFSGSSLAMEAPRVTFLKGKGLNDAEARLVIESFEKDVEKNESSKRADMPSFLRLGEPFETHGYVDMLVTVYLGQRDKTKGESLNWVFFVLRKNLMKSICNHYARQICEKLGISEESSGGELARRALRHGSQQMQALARLYNNAFWAFQSFREPGEPEDKRGFYLHNGKEYPTSRFPWSLN